MNRSLISIFFASMLASAASAQNNPATHVRTPQFAFVAISVSNIDAALRFYQTQLGLMEQFRNDTPKQVELGLDFPPGGTIGPRLILTMNKRRGAAMPDAGAQLSRIAFYVADVDATCRRLRATDVNLGCQPIDDHKYKVKVGFTSDPDGNRIELLQTYD